MNFLKRLGFLIKKKLLSSSRYMIPLGLQITGYMINPPIPPPNKPELKAAEILPYIPSA